MSLAGTKLFVPAKFSAMEQTLAQSHIPFPHANAIFVSLVEFAFGAGLVVGLLTPLVCGSARGRYDRRYRNQSNPQHPGERKARVAQMLPLPPGGAVRADSRLADLFGAGTLQLGGLSRRVRLAALARNSQRGLSQ